VEELEGGIDDITATRMVLKGRPKGGAFNQPLQRIALGAETLDDGDSEETRKETQVSSPDRER